MYVPLRLRKRQPSPIAAPAAPDLRAVRVTLERPMLLPEWRPFRREKSDGRAVADKIVMINREGFAQIAEDVLPEIEKFLESPADRRLRRLRAGIIMACIGLGACLGAIVASLAEKDLFVLVIPGLVAFFIGLGIMLNGLIFTVPRKQLADLTDDARSQRALDSASNTRGFWSDASLSRASTNELERNARTLHSVTEHTTHQLKVDR